MTLKAPMCKMCRHAHWGLEHVFGDVTKNVTSPPIVTQNVTPTVTKRNAVPDPRDAEIEALRAEVRRLKRLLAEAHSASLPAPRGPMTPAERMRAYRERRSAKAGGLGVG